MTHFSWPKTPTAAWLACARLTDDPEGDLIADMRGELRRGVELPALFANKAELHSYLISRSACQGALNAVPGVWRRYRQWLDRHGLDWRASLDTDVQH